MHPIGVDMTSACDIRYCTKDAWFQIKVSHHTRIHTYYIHTDTRAHTHPHTHARTYAHARTHAPTHTHTHTPDVYYVQFLNVILGQLSVPLRKQC
jgi:hypothetical protein